MFKTQAVQRSGASAQPAPQRKGAGASLGTFQQQRNAELAKSDLWSLINHAAMLNGSINYVFTHRCSEVGTGVCHLKHPYFAHIEGLVKNYSGCTHQGSVNHRPLGGVALL